MIFIFYLILCLNSATATPVGNNNYNINGGFSVQPIHQNSPNSPFYNHNNRNKAFRRLMSPSKDANLTQSQVKRDMDDGEGAQLMKLSIGTPPHDIYAVADTGSTLLWTQCEPCPGCYKQKNPKFDPEKVCNYNYSYLDETVTAGVVARETVTLTSTSGKPKP
ncbi:hypothetical protein PRUPE_6G344200 [Prunus persica]|uniref:Peptidase A1 domain-containing protein n=1 Tax=Prunus persica TaxID=3760 RepID=A0A251P1G1_PRUPE|nr:hypothetical protein PRUPE_6G344200 [Prunus persica]